MFTVDFARQELDKYLTLMGGCADISLAVNPEKFNTFLPLPNIAADDPCFYVNEELNNCTPELDAKIRPFMAGDTLDNSWSGPVEGLSLQRSLEALTGRAAQLPGISLEKPRQVIGRNTVDCMRSGMMFGTAAMLDGIVERMEQELGHRCTLVATGGLAPFIVPLCKREIILEKDLLLKGLNILYKKNKK